MRRMLRNYQVATFADLLAMLIEHSVPLPEAVVLAADSTGGHRLKEASRQIADAIQRGESLGPQTAGMSRFPPLLVWLMSRGQAQDAMFPALRQAAEMYHQRAGYQAEAARVFVPVILTMVIGGSVTLLYALLVLGSWFSILNALSYAS
jgi:type IV pilus assembly protein PilC